MYFTNRSKFCVLKIIVQSIVLKVLIVNIRTYIRTAHRYFNNLLNLMLSIFFLIRDKILIFGRPKSVKILTKFIDVCI
jgi:hypothetical protein